MAHKKYVLKIEYKLGGCTEIIGSFYGVHGIKAKLDNTESKYVVIEQGRQRIIIEKAEILTKSIYEKVQ